CSGIPAGTSSPMTASIPGYSGLARPRLDRAHGSLQRLEPGSLQGLPVGLTASVRLRMQPPPFGAHSGMGRRQFRQGLERAVSLTDGWHGSRLTAEAAAPVIKRLHTLRPDKTFTISLRTSFDGKDPAELGARLGAYRDAGAD